MTGKAVCRMAAGVLAVLLALLTVGCGETAGGKSFGFTLSAEPRQIDPQVAGDTASLSVISAVFEGLTRLEEDGSVVPGAAEWTVSPDGLTYTFRLRKSFWSTVRVRGTVTGFEDPLMVTAADFVFGIRRTADPATGSPYADSLRGIENAPAVLAGEKSVSRLGVEATDERTLVIHLSAPDEDFPRKLATPGFMPCNREFFAYTAGRYGLETRYILTNGAFLITNWEHNTAVSLRKNEHYHDADAILPAAVRYRISADAAQDFELLEKAYIDGAMIPPDKLTEAQNAGLRLVPLEDTVRYLWFNQSNEYLANADIRRALRDAVEWTALRDALGAGYTPAAGFVPPAATADGQGYRGEDTALHWQTDAAAARASLAGGLAALEAKSLPVLTLLAAEDTDSANLARYILQSFTKNLSVRCTLELVEEDTLAARVQSGNYQLAICDVTGRGLTAKENLAMFTSTGIGNYARFSSSAYDAAYTATNAGRQGVRALEQQLYDLSPALPIGFYTRYYGVLSADTGITVRPFNGGAFGALLSFRTADRSEK